ncbi:MAG: GPR endopeptidase [Clostridia bacterium]|nr:GPR endopeptidase [Clostridia bacterium]
MEFSRAFGRKPRPWSGFESPSDADYIGNTGSIRTDLAVEANELLQRSAGAQAQGVVSHTEETEFGSITRVRVLTDQAARALGKAVGNYVTIDAPDLPIRDRELESQVADALAHELVAMIRASYDNLDFWQVPDFTTLVCGLGNWNATPDAIGPLVAGKVMVTRHVYSMTPPEKRGGLKSVAAVSPGVLGITGVETAEIISGVVARVRPNLIIVVDALAARSVSRLGTTVQLSDTGIQPGSGVGNRRFGITRQSMGVPVIAVGVPTVVHALTIVADALQIMERCDRGPQPLTGVGPLGGPGASADTAMQLPPAVASLLQPYLGTLIVTPKEVDVLVKDLADVVAGGINYALHPAIEQDEIYQYLQ